MSSLPPDDLPPGGDPVDLPPPGGAIVPPSGPSPDLYQSPVFPPPADFSPPLPPPPNGGFAPTGSGFGRPQYGQPQYGGFAALPPPPTGPVATPGAYQPYRPGGPPRFDFGGFGGRLGAVLIDGLATGVLPAVIYFAGVIAAPEVQVACTSQSDFGVTNADGMCVGPDPVVVLSAMLVAFVVQLLLAFFVVIRPIGRSGQSIGLKAMGLMVVDAASGQPIGVARSLGRHLFASFLSGCVCYLGYFWMLFNDKKQTWHDMVTSSVVIRA